MSVFIYPSFNPEDKIDDNGEAMIDYDDFQALESLTQSAKSTSLMTFADNREIPTDFAGDPEELEEAMGPWDEWFDAQQGLAAVQDLLSFLKSDEDAMSSFDPESGVVNQLEACANLLAQAQVKKAKFRWEISH